MSLWLSRQKGGTKVLGAIDASTNPNYPAAVRGDSYYISVAGKIGGASGIAVDISDQIICIAGSSAAGTQAAVGANWIILQANVINPIASSYVPSSDGMVPVYSGTTGQLIGSSGFLIDTITADRLPFPIDGQAFVLTTGLKTPCRVVPFDCNIIGWNVSIGGAAAADTMTVDVQVGATGVSPSSICGAGTKPNLANAKSAASAVLTGWTVALTKGQDIYMNVTVAPTAATWVNVTLYVRRA
jgi:hypothetical protein